MHQKCPLRRVCWIGEGPTKLGARMHDCATRAHTAKPAAVGHPLSASEWPQSQARIRQRPFGRLHPSDLIRAVPDRQGSRHLFCSSLRTMTNQGGDNVPPRSRSSFLKQANHVQYNGQKSAVSTALVSPILDGCMSPLSGRPQGCVQSPRLISSPFSGMRSGCHTSTTRPLAGGRAPQQQLGVSAMFCRNPGEIARPAATQTMERVPCTLRPCSHCLLPGSSSNAVHTRMIAPNSASGLQSSCRQAMQCGRSDIDPHLQTMTRQKRLRAVDSFDVEHLVHSSGNALISGTTLPQRKPNSLANLHGRHCWCNAASEWSTPHRRPSATAVDCVSSPLHNAVPLSGRDKAAQGSAHKKAADARRCCSEGTPSPADVNPNSRNRQSCSAAAPRNVEPEASTGWYVPHSPHKKPYCLDQTPMLT